MTKTPIPRTIRNNSWREGQNILSSHSSFKYEPVEKNTTGKEINGKKLGN